MQLNGNGMRDGNLAWSDANAYRGADYVTNQNGAFLRGDSIGAVSSQFPHIQLYNPASSGVVLLLDKIRFAPSTTGTVYLRRYDTELTSSVGAGFSKLIGGAVAKGILRRSTDVGLLGTLYERWYTLANTLYDLNYVPPFEIGEGEGILVHSGATNVAFIANYEWREV